MSEKNPIDVQGLTSEVIRRDRRRVLMLATACMALWMAVVMLPWATILPMMAKLVRTQMAMVHTSGPRTAEQEQTIEMLQVLKKGTIATFVSSIASMFAAALCTVALIVLSRRATLRQVNARLAEISAQLKALADGGK